ncbi:MAG: hypothetical protein ABSH24_10930 [Bryobacteraceae bacterium]|jgi:hypothetical protein
MKVGCPYPPELLRVARKVLWYDAPERTLEDIPVFLAHSMVYGSRHDVELVEQYVSPEEFRQALENAAAGVFTQGAWTKWHKQLGIEPADSAIAPTPVSEWLRRTRSRAILWAVDFFWT